jgi:predicted AlkP superfamily pyrophosphatase or phosphodiesterase
MQTAKPLTPLSFRIVFVSIALLAFSSVLRCQGQAPAKTHSISPAGATKSYPRGTKPKLVVVLVVDQMRADYLEKFQQQWTGGLARLLRQGANFRNAAYPYAETETCVGHSTISTGSFPATHGMVSNEWWDREQQKLVTCTADPSVKNIPYGTAPTSPESSANTSAPGDSAVKMLVPSFAEELKNQSSPAGRIVTMSLKARAAITLAGHQADSVTWLDSTGGWTTSSAYPQAAFIENYSKVHPASADYGKTWAPLLADSSYLYEKAAVGAGSPAGFGETFPHPLRGNPESKGPDKSFYFEWAASPYADSHLTQMAISAVDQLKLGQGSAIDFLGVSFSSVDYVGHTFGPRSWEIQDVLARLDRDLAELFDHLDKTVGHENYVVAFSSDHGVAPIPEELQKNGIAAGRLNVEEVKARIERSLEPFHFAPPIVSEIGGANVYFSPGTYAKLKSDPAALRTVIDAILSSPGVSHVYQAEEVEDRPATENPLHKAEAAGFYKSRSGDLLIVPKPYWIWDYSTPGKPVRGGTSHGTPYYYDQRVPVILMGAGVRAGDYFAPVTPADIAPSLATLCGITLATRDSRALSEALEAPSTSSTNYRSHSPTPNSPSVHKP